VAIAKQDLPAGLKLTLHDLQLTTRQPIPSGHKLALLPIAAGEPLRRYGQVIGFATREILPGDHVHTHNLGMGALAQEYEFGVDQQVVLPLPEAQRRTFMGYRRARCGWAGTRNYIAVLSTVNCSAHAARAIAYHFTQQRLDHFPNVDGVIALTHTGGCGGRPGGPDLTWLQRTLAGMARHPNVGAALMVGLGCETNQPHELIQGYHLEDVPVLVIQELGGIRKTVEAGVALVEELLPAVNANVRVPCLVSDLALALQCGGSDGWSGITANPLVGRVSDMLVRQGGTVVLAETPEIYGAEHLLTRRAISPQVGHKLVEKVRWWERYAARMQTEINTNPSPGNKAGGLTTIYEKALGAIAKGGQTPLMAVYDYAAPVTAQGLTFMDTTGNDPMAITGEVAGGCNLVLFTTGRGSVFGFKPAPSIKIATNSALYARMEPDMDFNAGRALEGSPMESLADELLDLVIAVASGQPSKSELEGVGEAEFVPWRIGETI